jgi:hypothetical protein
MMTILNNGQFEVRQYGGGNGDEVLPREEDAMTTRASVRQKKTAPWVVVVAQGVG